MPEAYVRNHFLSDDLSLYIAEHTSPPDAIQSDLRHFTQQSLPNHSVMQIGDDQAVFMQLLVRSIGTQQAIEIGTFTGYSSITIARGLGPNGHLLCCDISEEWTATAREYWERSGLSNRIELKLAPALDTLNALEPNKEFDFGFIDADKTGYLDYYEALLPHLRPGGILLVDNTLQRGRVTDKDTTEEGPVAIRSFNDVVRNDSRVTSVLLSIGDGLTMIRKHANDDE